MFYFGGMTLGYLLPPVQQPKAEDGGKMANTPQSGKLDTLKEVTMGTRDLVARANWFSLYW